MTPAPALYNESSPFAAAWLQKLETHGHIAPGRVDQRSITELAPGDVAGVGQRHFFAGIGGWSHALRLAGVPDDADIWTGSCPCQGFSDAGKGLGTLDPRHLWPAWFTLIRECRPPILFGEQVASRLGLEWLDLVFADLERCGYAVGAADLCAASVGAPHQRQRLWFVAYTPGDRRLQGLHAQQQERGSVAAMPEVDRSREDGGMADAPRQRGSRRRERAAHRRETLEPTGHGIPGDMADGDGARLEVQRQQQARRQRETVERGSEAVLVGDPSGARGRRDSRAVPGEEGQGQGPGHPYRRGTNLVVPAGTTNGFWGGCQWILCREPSGGPPVARPIEPGAFPLAHGVSGRVGLLSGYGNAIVPQVGVAFILAALDAITQTF